eukprot:Rmarinus@m.27487
MNVEKVIHVGGCHCGGVRFQVNAPKHIIVWECNCSICNMKSNLHFVVPKTDFSIVKGQDLLTTYTFNTHQAKHMFCRVCGVQAFYIPRSNPDGYGINPRCVDPGTIETTESQTFDGQNWEQCIQNSSITSLSKPSA